MVRFLINAAVSLISSMLGILAAAWLIPEVTLRPLGTLTVVVVFTVVQAVLFPFVAKMARRYMPSLLGGIGIVSTLLALFLASLIPEGLTVSGFRAWILAPMVVWLVTAFGTWILVAFVFKKQLAALPPRNTHSGL